MTGTVRGRGAWGEVKVANYCGLEVAAKLLHDVPYCPGRMCLIPAFPGGKGLKGGCGH